MYSNALKIMYYLIAYSGLRILRRPSSENVLRKYVQVCENFGIKEAPQHVFLFI